MTAYQCRVQEVFNSLRQKWQNTDGKYLMAVAKQTVDSEWNKARRDTFKIIQGGKGEKKN